MMRQTDTPPPNLWQSRGRWRGMGSKGWVPTSTVQRLGAFVIGTAFVAGGLVMIGSSLPVEGKFQAEISSPPFAWVASFFVVAWALAVASFVIWLGSRLLAGCFRHSAIRKDRT
jgi:hypothetical protein